MTGFGRRVIGALTLRAETYEEVEHDRAANAQAALVVAAAAASSGLAAIRVFGWPGFVRQALVALVGWIAGAFVIWLIGTRILPGKRTEGGVDQLLRTLGFAQSPILFSAFSAIPALGGIGPLVIAGWFLLATIVAVRQALDYDDTLRAVTVCLLAWAVWLAVSMIAALAGVGVRVV